MTGVIIGVDPHKRSATIEVINSREKVLDSGRYTTVTPGYQAMLATGRRHRDRQWAVEGCNGTGRHLAQRLIADGETVIDVPAKLSARTRALATGHGRKTDAADAHHIAVTALRTTGLRQVSADTTTTVIRLLIDRRDHLGVTRTETINRLHQLLTDLIPGGAKKKITPAQARTLLAGVTATDPLTRTRHRLATELLDDLAAIDTRTAAATRELNTLLATTGSRLMSLHGIATSGAARLLADIGDIRRFPSRGHFATYNGTAPTDVSSGDNTRHRLSRAGNRRINRVLHIMATCQLRYNTEGHAYYHRKRAEGKTPNEAMRALKRRLSDLVYRQMTTDATTTTETGPGGHPGTTPDSSATGSHPTTGTSEQSLPGPATTHPKTHTP
jgi:transposase